jgi:nucleoside-diphosphate-sugar epimerase
MPKNLSCIRGEWREVTTEIIRQDLDAIAGYPLPWERFEGKTVLITGANGFLPAYMVETLLLLNKIRLREPVHVIALVRNESSAKQRFYRHSGNPRLEFLVQDVCEPINLKQKIHYIVHAASQASPKYFRSDPVGTLSANILGTANLLKLATECRPDSFLYFSSSEVYGELDQSLIPNNELTYGYLNPSSLRACYAESKRMGETMCVAWHHQHGVPVKIARPYHTYGPGMRLDDGRVFADFVRNVVERQNIVMKSEGNGTRPFCYISDATIGFFTVMLKGVSAEAYNVGNPECETSIARLADTMARLFPELGLKVIREQRTDNEYLPSPILRNCPDIQKINQLGWQPTVGIEQGFKRTVLSFGSGFES